MVHCTVDGRRIESTGGATLLDALRQSGVSVPTPCHDPRLEPGGSCRLCLVSVEGRPGLAPACSTAAEDGMVIHTATPEIHEARRFNLEMLAQEYPGRAVEADPGHPFHRMLQDAGVHAAGAAAAHDGGAGAHPWLAVDMARCIHCLKCLHICDDLEGRGVWRTEGRGHGLRVLPAHPGGLLAAGCSSCGACAETCPSGAITDSLVAESGRPDVFTRSTCLYCGVGCEMRVGTRDDRIVQILPAHDGPANHGHLCLKGRYAHGFEHSEDRLARPLMRRGKHWEEISWDAALDEIAAQFRGILQRQGPDAIGILASARGTHEEAYAAQKFARAVLGTHNVDCCARVCHAPTAAAMTDMFGTGAATASFDDIERAAVILVAGANPTANHPVVGARIRQAVRRGAKLIVVDPRRTELAQIESIHLAVRPGANAPLFNAMAAAILEENLTNTAFVDARTSGLGELTAHLRAFKPEAVAAACGVDASALRAAARLFATAGPALILHGLGMTEHVQGTDGVKTLLNLALLTGNLGTPGAGVIPLRGQNNVQGTAHMGCAPGYLTGMAALSSASPRFEQAWKVALPSTRGLDLMQMMDAALTGRLQALWVSGYDIAFTLPDTNRAHRALAALDLVVVQDLFMTETARQFAHLVLPAASGFEKNGTVMNAERRVSRVRKVLPPPGQAWEDWRPLQELAKRLDKGHVLPWRNSEEIWNEIRALWPEAAGITWERLDHGGLQWPCFAEDHPGTERLHETSFPFGPRAELAAVPWIPTTEVADDHFPMTLITGRCLEQFNAGTMTGRTRNQELRPHDLLDVHPRDAERFGLRDGGWALLESRYGHTSLPVHVSTTVREGEMFATFHTRDACVNRLTSPHRDSRTHTPEYKVTAVRVSPAPSAPD